MTVVHYSGAAQPKLIINFFPTQGLLKVMEKFLNLFIYFYGETFFFYFYREIQQNLSSLSDGKF